MTDESFKREIVFTPAFDRLKEGYGVHGVDCRFHLIGEQGATQLVIFTNWHLPKVVARLDTSPSGRFPHLSCRPMPADLGYHRLTPAWEGQDVSQEPCDLLGGRPCYYDGSGLMAKDVFEMLLREGDSAVWRELERVYREQVLAPTELSTTD